MCNCRKAKYSILELRGKRAITLCLKMHNKLKDTMRAISRDLLWEWMGIFIEESAEKVYIISGINMFDVYKAKLDIKSVEMRMKESARKRPIYDPETAHPSAVGSHAKNTIKLTHNWAFIEKFLMCLTDDLKLDSSFKTLKTCIDEYKKFEEEETLLHNDLKEHCSQACLLREKLRYEEGARAKVIAEKEEIIANWRDKYVEWAIKSPIACSLLYEKKRMINLVQEVKCKHKEKYMEDKRRFIELSVDKELINHYEVLNYLVRSKSNIEYQLNSWKQKSDSEFERLQIDLYLMAEKRDELQKKFKEVSLLYTQHEAEIAEYLLHEQEKKRRMEEEARLNAMATKIQAWWRGLMVRLQLGPYNPKKKKKGKAKGTKKNSKAKK